MPSKVLLLEACSATKNTCSASTAAPCSTGLLTSTSAAGSTCISKGLVAPRQL